jgi:hypothetical protein
MIRDKAEGKARLRHSLASRILGSAVRAALPVAAAQEPWRVKKPKGNNGGRKHK